MEQFEVWHALAWFGCGALVAAHYLYTTRHDDLRGWDAMLAVAFVLGGPISLAWLIFFALMRLVIWLGCLVIVSRR